MDPKKQKNLLAKKEKRGRHLARVTADLRCHYVRKILLHLAE